jgi:hypothetical protein
MRVPIRPAALGAHPLHIFLSASQIRYVFASAGQVETCPGPVRVLNRFLAVVGDA